MATLCPTPSPGCAAWTWILKTSSDEPLGKPWQAVANNLARPCLLFRLRKTPARARAMGRIKKGPTEIRQALVENRGDRL